MSPEDLAKNLRWAVSSVEEELPESDVASILVLVQAGEWVVALEALCTQIYEYDVPVSHVQRKLLVDLGDALDVHSAYLLGDPWANNRSGSLDHPAPERGDSCD